ncbi:MAG: SPASM domain-containing protein [Deltaproteobacteria bacterium]|nr:SPASM domain-containing protein [Deltaproteobacteria bacterium]
MFGNLFSALFSLKKVGIVDAIVRYPAIKIPLYRLFRSQRFAQSAVAQGLFQHAKERIAHWENKPPKILIEPSSQCNGSCTTCPRVYLTREKGIMDTPLYEKIVNQVAQVGIRTITLTGFGEPLLDPDFLKKIRIAERLGIDIFFFTNAILLTESLSEALLASQNLVQINLSVGGSNFKEYCLERRYASENVNARARENIKRLCALKKEKKSRTKINIQPVYPPESIADSLRIRRYWMEMKPDSVDGNIRHSFANNQMGVTPGYYAYVPCKQLWDAMLILWDGRVAMCCEDVNGRHIIGDLGKQTLKEVISGARLRKLRRLHLEGQRNQISTCRQCDVFSFWY